MCWAVVCLCAYVRDVGVCEGVQGLWSVRVVCVFVRVCLCACLCVDVRYVGVCACAGVCRCVMCVRECEGACVRV